MAVRRLRYIQLSMEEYSGCNRITTAGVKFIDLTHAEMDIWPGLGYGRASSLRYRRGFMAVRGADCFT